MHKYLFTILLFIISLQSHAEGVYMHILMKDGSTLVTDITAMPKITFEGGIMSIDTDVIQVDNIVKYRILNSSEDGIASIESDKMKVDLSKVGQGLVSVENLGKQPIFLFNVDGMNLPIKVNRTGETATIDFSDHEAGIYILKIGDQSIKCKKQ